MTNQVPDSRAADVESTGAPHFEDRHRELAAAADANADDHKGWDQWTTPSDSRLSAFRDATETLVDDLVAAVREVIEWKSEGGHRELDVPTQAMADRLKALDEASR